MGRLVNISKLAGIEYHGTPGLTQRCVDALVNIVRAAEVIQSARILSWFDGKTGEHSILLSMAPSHQILIKPGFTSGYPGEGPRGLSTALEILQLFDVEIEEYDIDREFHQRCEAGCLLSTDLERLDESRPVRPSRYFDYIDRRPEWDRRTHVRNWLQNFPAVLNFGLLDERLIDLATGFHENPDSAITNAFRRLEDIVRDRTDAYDMSGRNLFKRAFEGERSLLHWNDFNGGEQAGKADLFVAVFQAYRNPRAHREIVVSLREAVREFMLINQLYVLEALAVPRGVEI